MDARRHSGGARPGDPGGRRVVLAQEVHRPGPHRHGRRPDGPLLLGLLGLGPWRGPRHPGDRRLARHGRHHGGGHHPGRAVLQSDDRHPFAGRRPDRAASDPHRRGPRLRPLPLRHRRQRGRPRVGLLQEMAGPERPGTGRHGPQHGHLALAVLLGRRVARRETADDRGLLLGPLVPLLPRHDRLSPAGAAPRVAAGPARLDRQRGVVLWRPVRGPAARAPRLAGAGGGGAGLGVPGAGPGHETLGPRPAAPDAAAGGAGAGPADARHPHPLRWHLYTYGLGRLGRPPLRPGRPLGRLAPQDRRPGGPRGIAGGLGLLRRRGLGRQGHDPPEQPHDDLRPGGRRPGRLGHPVPPLAASATASRTSS